MRMGGTSGGGVKRKLVIKPFKSQPQVPVDFEEQTWNKLQIALDAISRKTSVAFSKEELCQAVEDACMHRLAPGLYAKLSEHCRRHINARVDSLKDQVGMRTEPYLILSYLP
jgi:cullin-4